MKMKVHVRFRGFAEKFFAQPNKGSLPTISKSVMANRQIGEEETHIDNSPQALGSLLLYFLRLVSEAVEFVGG